MIAISEKVLAEISAEREKQDANWGGAEHDKRHSAMDWRAMIEAYLLRAWQAWMALAEYRNDGWGCRCTVIRKAFVSVAALAIAALEHCDDCTPKEQQ